MDILVNNNNGQTWKLTAMSDRGATFLGLSRDGDSREYEASVALEQCNRAREQGLIVKTGF